MIVVSGIWRTIVRQFVLVCGIINTSPNIKLSKLIIITNVLSTLLLISSVLGLVLIVQHTDPRASLLNVSSFYVCLMVAVSSFMFIIGFYVRRIMGARELAMVHLKISMRQALWFALLSVVSLLLLSVGLFSWINASLLLICLIFLESYFLFK
jgi:hypothetical protein